MKFQAKSHVIETQEYLFGAPIEYLGSTTACMFEYNQVLSIEYWLLNRLSYLEVEEVLH